MARDLMASGVGLFALMTAGRWKTTTMPARYTQRQTAGWGAGAINSRYTLTPEGEGRGPRRVGETGSRPLP